MRAIQDLPTKYLVSATDQLASRSANESHAATSPSRSDSKDNDAQATDPAHTNSTM